MSQQLYAYFHRYRRSWAWGVLGWVGALAIALLVGLSAPAQPASNYALSQAAAVNQVAHYPIQPLPSSADYRPVGEWLGRLILPAAAEYDADPGDWAWLEIWHSPDPNLLGKTVKLTWQASPALETYLEKVTREVQLTQKAESFAAQGNIVPSRLNGRRAVGPLQSLAGARPQDDVAVKLAGQPQLITTGTVPVVTVALEPIQVTGREYSLVKILEPDTRRNRPRPEVCPGEPPCPTEYFQVQHFDPATKDFSGLVETIRIPQQPMLKDDRFSSNIRDLADSPAGREGWYIYGAVDRENMFTVQALKPRALFQVQPDEVILGETAGRNYIDRGNWRNSAARKGTLQRVLVSPTATGPEAATAAWQEGDYALVMHLFGGIGGENKELTPLGTVTGHFSFGLAQIAREPITQELQFNIHYQQIYAHNTGGIVSGTQDWTAYAGDMQRGWIGQRPFSDILVKLDEFEDLPLGETRLSLFEELLIQSQVMMARYRTGDGTGVATVTPATSCVQDSSQALYIAIAQIRHQAETDPNLVQWIANHPKDPNVQRIDRFAALGKDLTQALSPYGVVRSDWQNNAETLAGVNARGNQLANRSGLVAGIFSWRSMMPRWAQDDLALIFLKNDADLWFLRTNQLGGFDPSIAPIPPTALFGLIPGVSRVALRLARSFAVPLSGPWVGAVLLSLGMIAIGLLPFGLKSGYLQGQIARTPPLRGLINGVKLFLFPALAEEIVFRVMLLPHPTEGISPASWLAWAALSIGLFVIYHWGLSQVRPEAGEALRDRRFLLMVVWFGLILTLLYGFTGSLWAVTVVHWVVVLGWIYGFGGYQRLQGMERQLS
ncbi:CPBP family glutamic-type intramembrane protease [Lyngbya confervoides]|uniref:CPBP family glutamic-type intramembrane protease n=1 Tax=Lyngbya confervoides BDU141951 TaxID=1574623 RepID=A0ABD4T945_9CYAN|nr:CPBP family glutamic-type intramembrane protease [Lyngbya confervoides]MCM1984968.1 CPBP family glutamic-type intramembrane protease [Lyngbya confervoides BDU141951]